MDTWYRNWIQEYYIELDTILDTGKNTLLMCKILHGKRGIPGVVLGWNWVRLPDAALDDLFFSKICFIKKNVRRLWT